MGVVLALSVRPARSKVPLEVAYAHAIGGMGLEGDIHADPLSPRQVLVAGSIAYDRLGLSQHALRENLLVDGDTSQLASGTVLQVGDDVLIQMMFQCEACGKLDTGRPGLSGVIGDQRGVLARVLAGGALQPGDRVRNLGPLLPPWSDDWHDRVRQVLESVPLGMAVEYGRLARLAGVASTYCRAFPGLLRKLGPAYAGKAVPARAAHEETRWDGAGFFELEPAAKQALDLRIAGA